MGHPMRRGRGIFQNHCGAGKGRPENGPVRLFPFWEIIKEKNMAENEILNSTAVEAGNEYDASEIQVLEG